MLSEAVLVEWMDILSSAGVKVREFFKNFFAFFFYECLSPWSPCILFFFSFLPAHPSVSLDTCLYISAIFLVGLRSVRWRTQLFFPPLSALPCLRH